jgi:hypothetical protein
MLNLTSVLALAAAVVLALLAVLARRSAKASKRVIRRLQQRIAALERERAIRPAPRVAFEFNGATREALLHVTNDGGDAQIWAPLTVEGALSQQLAGDACAAWGHGGGARATIRRGQTGTLRLAQLDLTVFPYAQWQIYAVAPPDRLRRGAAASSQEGGHDAGVRAVRAMHTSMIGGDPETHAPALFLQVALLTAPDSVAPLPHCTIALQPFEAIRLRPI